MVTSSPLRFGTCDYFLTSCHLLGDFLRRASGNLLRRRPHPPTPSPKLGRGGAKATECVSRESVQGDAAHGLRLRGEGRSWKGRSAQGAPSSPAGFPDSFLAGERERRSRGTAIAFGAMVNRAAARGGPCSRAGGFAFSGGRPA